MEYHLSLTLRLTAVVISVILIEMAITGCVAGDIVIQARVGEDVLLPCPFNYGLEDVDLLQWREIDGDTVVHLAEMNAQGARSAISTQYSTSNLDLFIRNVSFEDAGRYQCHVSHKVTEIPSIENYILLHLYARDSRDVQVGDNITLQCSHPTLSVEGLPISWARQSHHLSSEYNLTVGNFSTGDTGLYECNVTSEADVTYIAHQTLLRTTVTTKDVLKGRVGESVTVSCTSSGELRNHTDVHWKKYPHGSSQGVLIASFRGGSTAPGYTVSSDFSLTIENISPDDEGIYECYQPATQGTAGVLHIVSFHALALPVTSPHIDGCRGDEKQCERTILFGTDALFTCRTENVYPERYPTWGEHDEYVGHSVNSDGTFNTWCVVYINGSNTPAERNCTFALEAFHESSHLVVKGHSLDDYPRPIGWMTATFIFGFMFLLSFAGLLYAHSKRFRTGRQRTVPHDGYNYNPTPQSNDESAV